MSEAAIIDQTATPLTVEALTQQFAACGLRAGQTVVVHSSMSKIGWIAGGPVAVVQALQHVLTESGTLVMPTNTTDNTDPAGWYLGGGVPETWWPIIRQHMPAYDPLRTPSNRMGVIAETFRTWPGTRRSSHPIGSLAAWGQHAAYLTAEHPLADEFGPSSPLGKVYELDGWVLLLGVGYKNNSSLHVAEYRAQYPGKRLMKEGCAVLVDGVRQWVSFDTLDLYADDFEQIGTAFEAAGGAQLGQVGNAPVRLMRQRALVDFAVEWMTRNRDLTHNEAATSHGDRI